jgi:general secretion pathway protein C
MNRAARAGEAGAVWPSRARFAVEAVATAALAFVLAQLVWAGYPPFVDAPTAFGGPDAAASALASRPSGDANPFARRIEGVAARDPLADAPETTLNLKLMGVRTATRDGDGSAILQTPDNEQRLYRVGDEVVGGVTLAAVEPGRVVILRNGALESVLLSDRESLLGGVAAQASAETEAPRVHGPVAARALMDGIAPTARAEGGVIVQARGDGAALAAAGLAPGDVVLAVDGARLEGLESWAAAVADAQLGAPIVLEIERAGGATTIRLVLE